MTDKAVLHLTKQKSHIFGDKTQANNKLLGIVKTPRKDKDRFYWQFMCPSRKRTNPNLRFGK